MGIFRDVEVNITKLTQAVQIAVQGLCLVLTTESAAPYTTYSDLVDVAADFNSTTSAYKMASALFAQSPSPSQIAITGIVEDTNGITDIVDGLNTVLGQTEDFTFIVSDLVDDADIAAIAQWATGNKVYYVAVITEAQVSTITNPESDYVIFLVHDKKPEQFADAALVGKLCTYTPGSATWMFKTLSGISPVEFDNQNNTVTDLNDSGYMTYVQKYGVNMTTGGFVTSGEYVDVMLGVDWIQDQMERRIQSLLLNNAKINYDNGGISLIAAEVESVLKQATENDIIRRDTGGLGIYNITFPDVSEIDSNKIANRVFDELVWDATLAGAIHHVVITGTVHY